MCLPLIRQSKLMWSLAVVAASVGATAVPASANDEQAPSPDAFNGTFSDDDGSAHEGDIERIAEWGVTLGCGGDRFCPSMIVTRAQMAAFLYRAAERLYGTPDQDTPVRLADVADDAWYRPYAQWAAANNVIRAAGGTFNPGGTVTRADMAEMLIATFDHLTVLGQSQGVFADTADMSEAVVEAIESIHASSITRECDIEPLRYCPNLEITRAQMASFIVQAMLNIGLILNHQKAAEGYMLFTSRWHPITYLIDHWGRVVHTWELADGRELRQAKMLANGNLIARIYSKDSISIAEIDRSGRIVWEYINPNLHHDFIPLPNGNVLVIVREFEEDIGPLIAAGFNQAYTAVEYDKLLEIRPNPFTEHAKIVWEWSVWDHLIQDYDPDSENYGVIAKQPERINANAFIKGHLNAQTYHNQTGEPTKILYMTHMNAVDYNSALNQILLTPKYYSELWIINHSTTTEEAAGSKGDLLYRWGNSRIYQTGDYEDQRLFWPHNAHWVPPGLPGEGNILVFNNGNEAPGLERFYSSVDEITPPPFTDGLYQREPDTAFGPTKMTWTYTAPNTTDFYAPNTSGAQRLPNGNTLIVDGPRGTVFQVTSDGTIVWKYVSPVNINGPMRQGDSIWAPVTRETPSGPVHTFSNALYRVEWHPPDYPGLQGLDLSPRGHIELDP